VRAARATWGLEPGDAIAPGRSALRLLGGGSRFETYLAWDERLYALVVAKLVRPDQVQDPLVLHDLRQEAEAIERLAHPVVVRVFDVVLDGPRPHLVLEHLEGPTLRSLIRRHGPLGLEQVVPLAVHLAAALHFAAACDMVHLDVKPDNVIMGVPPRLIDLSVARPVPEAARLRLPIGTDAYMAPEQCDPAAHPGAVGPHSDVWGLGATVFHALAGEVPFPREPEDRHAEGAVRFPQLVTGPISLPARVPDELHVLVDAALAPAPQDRPTAAQFAAACEPVLERLPSRIVLGKRGARFR
jgi:serine/threonine protein kinase